MEKPEISTKTQKNPFKWLTPRRLRIFREYSTAYLMIAPSTILVFLFGIFPVGFALFVSVHKWRLKRGNFVGLKNYVGAVGDIAYLGVFILGIAALVFAFLQFKRVYRQLNEKPQHFWFLLFPSFLQGAATLAFIRWTIILLPNILDIADKIRGVEKTRQLFMQ
ncbi:MAG: sugar ABC transporter permease [Anaerolineales bacterium]|nr:sugar ABC transporter permease [Anaerolineales bacterium]